MSHLALPCAGLLAALVAAAPAADPEDTLPPPRPVAVAKLANAAEARRALGLLPHYASVPRIGAVKVAVLDSGFDGVGPARPYLPADAVVVEHYDPEFVRKFGLGDPEFRKPFLPGYAHGRLLAQLVWATAGGDPAGPKFYLLNANGPTLFRRAVRYAIEAGVDVILFGGTFEGAGNYDGRGPINAAVDQAVAAGIIWVNAAGNCGGCVYNGPVDLAPGGYLRFGGANGRTALWFRNRLDEHAVTVTLTWNDYADAEDAGTDKDLDLYVEDVRGRVVGKGELRQVPAGRAAGDGETKNPREKVVLADLPATPAGQEYRIRVRAKAGAFGPADRVRILVTGARVAPVPDPATGKPVPPLDFLDASKGGEIYPPADHPGVLTVGDASRSSAVGPTADGRAKPDVVLDFSAARFTNGEESDGSSNAAAYFAGVAAVLRATEPAVGVAHVKEWVRRLDRRAPAAVAVAAAPPPPAAVVPLTPNQERALRFAAWAADDQKARGVPSPGVWVSGSGGTLVMRPGGKVEPPPGAPVPPPPPPALPATPPRRSPHAAWQTPPPATLAELVRRGP